MTWAIFTSAFRSSPCCGTRMWRICTGDGQPDRYVCDGCKALLWERATYPRETR